MIRRNTRCRMGVIEGTGVMGDSGDAHICDLVFRGAVCILGDSQATVHKHRHLSALGAVLCEIFLFSWFSGLELKFYQRIPISIFICNLFPENPINGTSATASTHTVSQW